MVGDEPGYSRYILPAGSPMPGELTDDITAYRKIDVNDGVTKGPIMPKVGWAAGKQVSYWDFGLGKRGASAAYGLANCNGTDVMPTGHPVIVDNVPGDSDYSPYRALQYACVTSKYANELIVSFDAFSDAIDLGLITDPTSNKAAFWINQPVTTHDAVLSGGVEGQEKVAFYRGSTVHYHDMFPQEAQFAYDPMTGVQTGNVYELVKPGSMAPVKVIFSQPFFLEDGQPNPKYSPAWIQVTVTLKAPTGTPPGDMAALNAAWDTLIASLNKESDLVTVGMMNALTVVNTTAITSAVATTNRVNRPFVVKPGAM